MPTNLELLQQLQPGAPAPQAPQPATPAPAQEAPGYIADMGQGVLAGARGFGQSVLDLGEDVAQLAAPGVELPDLPEVDQPQTLPGSLVKGVTQFGMAFLPIGGAMGALGAGASLGRAAAAGAAADFVAFGEAEERLSNVLIEFDNDLLNNAVTQYLAADPEDGWAEGRFKNVLEGAGIGAATNVLFKGVKMLRGQKAGGLVPEMELKAQAADIEADISVLNGAPKPADTAADTMSATKPKVKAGRLDTPETADDLVLTDVLNPENKAEILRRARMLNEGKITAEDVLRDMPLPSLEKLQTLNSRQVVEEIGVQIRSAMGDGVWDKPQTINTVRGLAADMGQDPVMVLKNLEALGGKRDEVAAQIMAGVGLTERLADELPDMVRRVDAGTMASEELDQYLDLAAASVQNLREAGSTLGRGLNVLKYNDKAGATALPAEQARAALKDLNISGDREAFKQRLRGVRDPGVVARVLHKATNNRTWDVLNEYWINAILSGPKTHAVNMASTLLHSVVRPLEDGIGGVLTGDVKAARRMMSQYAGMVRYSGEALRYAKQAFGADQNILTGRDTSLVGELPQHAIKGAKGTVIRSPTRALMSEDEFFKQMNYRARVYAKAVEAGMGTGLKGNDLRDFIDERFDKAFDEDGRGLDQAALAYTNEATFTNELGSGSLGHSVQKAVNEHPALRQIFPFVRTPTNLFRQAFRRVPALGLFQRDARRILKTGSAAEKATLMGQQVIGTSIMMSAYSLALAGNLTGAAPKDPALRDAFHAERQPYSVKVGDSWYSYDRFDPFGMLLGVVADLVATNGEMPDDASQELSAGTLMSIMENLGDAAADPLGAASGAISAVSRNVFAKTYLQTAADLLETLQSGDENKARRFLSSKLGSFVPNILRQTNPDPTLRHVRGEMDEIMQRLPGFSDQVEPRFNMLGKPVIRQGHPLMRALSPSQHFVEPNHPVWQELNRLGQAFRPMTEKQGNVPLTEFRNQDGKTAYARVNELLAASGVEEKLTKLIQSPSYQRLSDNTELDTGQVRYTGSKIGLIQKVLDQYRKVAMAKLRREPFVNREGRPLQEALRNDLVNRQAMKAPGREPLPIQ